ncbi:hypothetical protein B0H17DRAFT_1215444 [Mycena rosella]|uniref:Uncharacterized protein n=1 Tax=Mycena rosella TaxID=1033263 RepID=A0AAD7CJE6_MYCRO|nr:hypothetical protein B0H17DRAFT_1215444 [Mycena rosella]
MSVHFQPFTILLLNGDFPQPGIGTPSTISGLFEHRPMLNLDMDMVFMCVHTMAAVLYKRMYHLVSATKKNNRY